MLSPCPRDISSRGLKREIASTIRRLLRARDEGKTICPSDVARALRATGWRELMPEVRDVAAGMKDIVATQRGDEVDARTARGPIRLGFRA